MKKAVVKMGILLLIAGITSCSFISDTVKGVSGFVEDTEASLSRGVERAVLSATGLADLEASMVALLVYTNAFYAGGFVYGYENFQEGDGVEWRVSSRDGDGEEQSITVTRALLKELENGDQWWLLGYADEESELISEALMDQDYELIEFHYRDPESGDIINWIPEREKESEEASKEAESVEQQMPEYYSGNWESYIEDSETLKTPAGNFRCDRVLIEQDYSYTEYDEDGNETEVEGSYRYQWWVNKKVPGRLVQYRWEDSMDDILIEGEIQAYGSNYSSRLDSF